MTTATKPRIKDATMRKMLRYMPCEAIAIPQSLRCLRDAEMAGYARMTEDYKWVLTETGKAFLDGKVVEATVPEDAVRQNLAATLGFTNQGFGLSQLSRGGPAHRKETGPQPLGIPAIRYAQYVKGVLGQMAESDEMYDGMLAELKAWLDPKYGKEIVTLPIPELKEYVKKVWPDVAEFHDRNGLW